ncbi:alpha/beta hydrolase family protein [Bifidobacterium avesanii]
MHDGATAKQASTSRRGDAPQEPWTPRRRVLTSLPIFIMLLGLLVTVSNLSNIPWDNEPTGQTLESLSADTSVTFENPTGEPLPKRGDYEVEVREDDMTVTRASTGETESLHVVVRMPKGAEGTGGKIPGVVFMHGAGYGLAKDWFVDVGDDLASAGFATIAIDKPVWSTNDVTRDYPASADAYEQAAEYLRALPNVDGDRIGIYATSESTWISAFLLEKDPRIAFQILVSPMVHTPRHSLGFLAAQDFALVGANPGYQSIVRRVFSADLGAFGLTNFDIDTDLPRAYAIPTFVAYGSKDVMTAQVEGAERIFDRAHAAGNWDVTVRDYPVGNHVLRIGDEEDGDTKLADHFEDDMVDWAVGKTRGLTQTDVRVAGADIYQSIAVPQDLYGHRTLTFYMVILHVAAVTLLLAAGLLWLAALVRRLVYLRRHRRWRGSALGFLHGFGNVLAVLFLTTLAVLYLFGSGLAQVVMEIVSLVWGAAPASPDIVYWSWPVIQFVCTAVVWAWARVFARLIEVAQVRGYTRMKGRELMRHVREPIIATTRFARVLFWVTAAAMLCVLLVFAFWGMFIY